MDDNTRLMIDGSHMRASDLDYLIIREAMSMHGLRLGDEDLALYEKAARDYSESVSGLAAYECEALRELSEEAMTYMSDRSGGFAAYYVEDSCLWVEFDPDQSVEG